MRVRNLPGYLRDTAFRFLPHRARTGLIPIGRPGPESPVLVTGNFTLTVRRLEEVLAGHNAWLVVANSKGINVWCAAGGGHLTHHDIITALRVARVADTVTRREAILPQLAATGVERRAITEATGFETRWGPARLEDLPAFLDRGARVVNTERFMRFPLWERMEMATASLVPMLILVTPIVALVSGVVTALGAGLAMMSALAGTFSLLPWLPVNGPRRMVPLAGFALAGWLAGAGLVALLGAASPAHLAAIAGAALSAAALLFADLAGMTPWHPSSVNTGSNPATITLDETRCTGAADCVQVCPRQVLKMNGRRRKVEILEPGQCIQCGACIVQCPSDALLFRYADGSTVEAPTIRSTRMNMLGKRRTLRH